MMTKYFRHVIFFSVTLLVVLLPDVLFTQVKIKLPFTVADGGGNGRSGTLWFGYHPDATYCIDSDSLFFSPCDYLKEFEYPPAPQTGIFDIRFVDSRPIPGGCLGQGVLYDIHAAKPAGVADTFRVQFQPSSAGGYPFKFSWPSNLSQYFDVAKIKYGVRADTVVFNMLTQSSFDLSDGDIPNFRIIVYGAKGTQTPPTEPVLQLPVNGEINQPLSLNLSWGTVATAVLYQVEVATDSLFSTIIESDTVRLNSKVITGLPEGRKLFWHARAYNEVLAGCYQATPFSFVTLLNPPALISPSEGETNVNTDPILRWRKIPAVTQYDIEVSRNSTFTDIHTSTSSVDTFIQVGPLDNCVTYYWRVKASTQFATSNFSTGRSFSVIDVEPAAPDLVNPTDSTVVAGERPTFSWTGDICSRSYLFELALDTGFTQIVSSQTGTGTSFQTTPIEGETEYFWRVTAKNGLGVFGPRSVTRLITTPVFVPRVPLLQMPANAGPPVPDSTVNFVWNRPPNKPTSYQLEIDVTSNFNSPSKIVLPNLTDTTYFVDGLDFCTKYFWRVNAANSAGTSQYSPVFSFDVRRNIPRPPTNLGPADGTTGVPDDTTLYWKGDACTQGYFIEIALDSTFTNVVLQDTLSGVSINILVPEPLTWYYWRVASVNEFGVGPFSTATFQTIALTRPKAPLLLSPANGTLGVLQYPVICWDSSKRTETYRLQVALDSNFTTLVFNDSTITSLCKQVGPLLFSRTYYWRVNAKNAAGTSLYSTVRWFNSLFPPATSQLIYPENGVSGVSVSPDLQWSIPDRADGYQLQVARDPEFQVIIYNDTTIKTQSWQLFNLSNRTWHYWRVRAKNTAGYGAYSNVYSFQTTIVGVADWVIPLAVSETGFGKDTVYFGLHPNATYGVDPRIGEFELPPPAVGQFDARFVDIQSRPNLLGQGLRLNRHPFRTYTQVDTFKVSFQLGTGEYPMYFSWNSGFIRGICDSMILMDMFGGLSLRERMDEVSSAVLTNISTKSLLIISYGALPVPNDVNQEPEVIPEGFVLSKNYPNPFNPTTRIDFSNEKPATIYIAVFDVLGREVNRLINSEMNAGNHSISWNGENTQGLIMPSGIYYVRMIATTQGTTAEQPFTSSQKMLFLK